MVVLRAVARQELLPGALRVVEHEGDKAHLRLFGRIVNRTRRDSRRLALVGAQQGKEIAFEDEAQDEEQKQTTETDATAARQAT